MIIIHTYLSIIKELCTLYNDTFWKFWIPFFDIKPGKEKGFSLISATVLDGKRARYRIKL